MQCEPCESPATGDWARTLARWRSVARCNRSRLVRRTAALVGDAALARIAADGRGLAARCDEAEAEGVSKEKECCEWPWRIPTVGLLRDPSVASEGDGVGAPCAVSGTVTDCGGMVKRASKSSS